MSRFMEDVKQATATFFLVFLNLDMVLRIIQLQESSPTFEKVSELE